jgi:hypothetical protein
MTKPETQLGIPLLSCELKCVGELNVSHPVSMFYMDCVHCLM